MPYNNIHEKITRVLFAEMEYNPSCYTSGKS